MFTLSTKTMKISWWKCECMQFFFLTQITRNYYTSGKLAIFLSQQWLLDCLLLHMQWKTAGTCSTCMYTVNREIFASVLFPTLLPSLSVDEFKTGWSLVFLIYYLIKQSYVWSNSRWGERGQVKKGRKINTGQKFKQ